jgi:glycosyltransferase involved in cell wall biosynthesis
MPDQPFVSVVTPVYNGAKYLAACMESVLRQTYPNLEYVVLDNASTDDTPAIAARFAAADARVRVVRNDATLPMIRNWNAALALIAPDSAYCKVVHADDVIYPEFLERMVALAERHPAVGVFGARVQRGERVLCDGLAPDREVFDGRDIVRLFLSESLFALAPSSCMMRSALVRGRPFFPEKYLHADHAAFFDLLDRTDFGFVHDVLCYSRTHAESVTTTVADPRQTAILDRLFMLREFGPRYFDAAELAALERRHLRYHYRVLVRWLLTRPDRAFLRYHLDGLRQAGRLPDLGDLALAVAAELRASLASPEKVLAHLRGPVVRH